MAKAPTPATGERTPVTARGLELLALIAGAPEGVLMLTQDEGLDAVNSGYAVVDTTKTEGNTAAVSLTDAGKAALAGSGGVATKFAIRSDVALPTTAARRGRQSSYPFEMLELNQSFHVPVSGDKNAEALAASLQSSVSGARTRFATDSGETETYTKREYAKDAEGKFTKDAEGKRQLVSETEAVRPVKTINRDFKLAIVGADDPDGTGVRVWRIK